MADPTTDPTLDLCTLFAAQAARVPERVAVADLRTHLTYRELAGRVDVLARRLRTTGVRTGDLVGLSLDRSVDLVVAMLAILRAGAAYVPLPPTYPVDRLAFMASRAGIRTVVADAASEQVARSLLPDPDAACVLVGDDGPADGELPGPDATRLAYVMYTSGSTGEPKGVMVEHRNVVALMRGAVDHYQLDETDVWAMTHSYAFDFSVWEIWGALAFGGRLLVLPTDVVRSPETVWQYCVEHGVTVLSATPSYFAQIAAAAEPRLPEGALRYVTFGGEALSPSALRPWYRRFGDDGPTLVNMYGITETTVHVTAQPLDASWVSGTTSIIGTALPHLELELRDADGRPTPDGEVGEIHVGGAGVARGYHRQPELTAQRFVTDAVTGRRMYRSGDLARRLPTGAYEYLGRGDAQVKVRGFRVEPAEIEAVLAEVDHVRHCVVLPRPGDPDGRLVAYLVASDGALDVDLVRRAADARLPDFMRPSFYLPVHRIPLTANGKVDRAALPEPGDTDAGEGGADEVESQLLEIWRDVLGVACIGSEDEFFAVGGDSMMVMRVALQCRKQGLPVRVNDVYRHPTVAALARIVHERRAESDGTAPESTGGVGAFALVSEADRDAARERRAVDAYPMTSLQVGMVFESLRRASGNQVPYHAVCRATVRAALDLDRLRAAFATAVARHEILRTSFWLDAPTEPLQLVHEQATIPVTEVDLQDLAPADQQQRLDELAAEQLRTPLDLQSAPLLRVVAARTAEDRFVLVWVEHHAILDGWSSATMLNDVVSRFVGRDGDAAPDERIEPTPFVDHVGAERHAVASGGHREWWASRLAGRAGRPRLRGARSDVVVERVDLDPDLTARLDEIANADGTPVKSLLLAAHAAALGSGADGVVGVVGHGRPDAAGGEAALGLFLNTLPVPTPPTDDLRTAARAYAAFERDAFAHRLVPQAVIERDTGVRLDNAMNFVDLQILHDLDERDIVRSEDLRAFAATELPLLAEFSRDALTGDLDLEIAFDGTLFGAEQRAEIGDRYRQVLDTLTGLAPPAPAAAPGAGTDADVLLPARIAAVAAERPALSGAREVTYGGLRERAQDIARGLRTRGIGRGDVVALDLRAHGDLVAAMLACWSAGAAFVALSELDPPARREAVVAASGARLVLGPDGPTVDDLAERGDGPVDTPIAASDLAYLCFTSGTSGRPKAVRVTHSNLAALASALIERAIVRPDDTVLAWTSAAFDISLVETVVALAAGAHLVAPTSPRDPVAVVAAIRSTGVTLVQGTPSLLGTLVDAGWTGPARVVSGGEVLPPQLAARLTAGGCEVWNGYGPTEATVYTTVHRVDVVDDEIPIGTALPGVRVLVGGVDVDADGLAAGELLIGGTGVAHADGADDVFLRDASGARWYRSGDRVARDGEQLLFRGRVDDQVKIHGVRIEPAEVEAAVRAVDGVVDVGVVVRDGAVVAAVVTQLAPHEITAVLAGRLPTVMIPSVQVVSALPLTAAGKLDRATLAARTPAASGSSDDPAVDRSPVQAVIAEAWAAVLGTPVDDLDLEFFAAGGDSLALMRLAARLGSTKAPLGIDELVMHRTIREQALTVG